MASSSSAVTYTETSSTTARVAASTYRMAIRSATAARPGPYPRGTSYSYPPFEYVILVRCE